MSAQSQRRTHDDLVKDGGGSVDDQLATAGCADDTQYITGVHFSDGNAAFPAEEFTRTLEVAISAPNVMSLTDQQLCKEGTGGSGSQNEDAHGVGRTLPHPNCDVAGRGLD